jgi:antitoxin component of RelBE/YafQ-DinJ toxin-antitoxin module
MTTTLHIKTDTKVRDQVEKLAKQNGLTVTALVNISLRSLIKRPVLELDLAPEPNARTRKIIDQARNDYKAGKNISGPFRTVAELRKHLES